MEAYARKRQPTRRLIGSLDFHSGCHWGGQHFTRRYRRLYRHLRWPWRLPGKVAAPPVEQVTDSVHLLVGRSTIVNVGKPIRAGVADERRHRGCARDVAERAAHQRQGRGHDFDVRVGPAGIIRRYEVVVQRDLSRGCPHSSKSSSPRNRLTCAPTARPQWLSGERLVQGRSPTRWRASPGASSTAKRSSSPLLQVGQAGRSNQVLFARPFRRSQAAVR